LDFGIDKKKLNATNFKKRWWPHYNEVRRIITSKSWGAGYWFVSIFLSRIVVYIPTRIGSLIFLTTMVMNPKNHSDNCLGVCSCF
jgi:hypothetical protein